MADRTYDYIIIGAGSAGCVLANRLSADPSTSVLVLEAGAAADALEISMPAGFSTLFKTDWDWNFETEPQAGLGGRRSYWPRMKATGGCSSMNAMIYMRGAAADYDAWQRDFGATGWTYEDVLPHFRRSEANQVIDDEFHGTTGPLHVEDRVYTHELTHAAVAAGVAAGLPFNPDFNGEDQYGVGTFQVTCKNGRRWSTAAGYLEPALDRPNLDLETEALTTRILIDGHRAHGVEYLHGGEVHTAEASGEVVVSGGAINSPQLLMLSGIGPADHLREHGIEPVVNLGGVGANLHDHPVTPLLWRTRNTTDLAVDHNTPLRLAQWSLTGRGPLASNIGEGGAFFSTRPGLEGPDIQFHFAPTGFHNNGFDEHTARMFTIGVTLVDVASRGRLRLRSADPRWRPLIDPHYFAEAVDRQAMAEGLRRAAALAAEEPLAGLIAGPTDRDSDDLDAATIDRLIEQTTQTLYHPAGTCAMGTGEGAVVDPELRVHGVDGVRVVDASVMPRVPRGNTNAPTIMMAEKASDLIRGTAQHTETTKEYAR